MLWTPIALAAVCLQTWRFALQKALLGQMSAAAATWTRYLFALPLLPLILFAALAWGGAPAAFTPLFLLWCALAGAAQIVATMLILSVMARRNFAVGVGFSKTEALFAAALGAALFGEALSPLGLVGVLLGGAGAWLLFEPRPRGQGGAGGVARNIANSAVAAGLAAGFLFALTAWFLRLAGRALPDTSPFVAAACALALTVALQAAGMGLWLWRRQTLAAIWRARRAAAAVGVSSVLGSYCWYAAFMLANPAYVKTLAQLEVPLALLVGRRFFGETSPPKERWGIAVCVAAAVCVAFA